MIDHGTESGATERPLCVHEENGKLCEDFALAGRQRCARHQEYVDRRYAERVEPHVREEQERLRDVAIEARTKDLISRGHTPKSARKMAAESLKDVVPDVMTFVAINANAYDDVERRAKDLMASEGLSHRDAMQLAINEATPQEQAETVRRPKDEYLGGSIESIAFDRKGGKGGGSKSKRTGPKKRGTWVCVECHLEFCEHRPKAGRPRKEEEVRDIRKRVHMTPSTHKTIQDMGLGVDDALAAFAIAVREGRQMDDVLTEWRAKFPAKGAPPQA